MNTKLDPKVEFYLERVALIKEWAELRPKAEDAACEFFLSLEPGIRALAEKVSKDVVVKPEIHPNISKDNHYAKQALWRSGWGSDDHWVIVGVFRDSDRLLFDGFYTGVFENRSNFNSQLKDSLAQVLHDKGYRAERTYFLAKRYVSFDHSQPWLHQQEMRTKILHDVEELWNQTHEIITDHFKRYQA